MNDPFSVESLLEEAEREVYAQKAREARGNRTTIDASRDPRLMRRASADDRAAATAPQPSNADAKRSSSNDNRYSVEREENDQRRSRRSRDLDEELKESSDPASANGSVRSRRRSRSPVRSRRDSRDRDGYRARERDYNRYAHVRDVRDRDRPGSGDYYNGTGRPSAYDDDRYRPGGGRDRSPPRRDRDRDRPPRGSRDHHKSHESRRVKSPEPTDDERDRRTVFVQQLAARLRTKELKSFFEQVGPVVEAQIVKDRVSQRSKGYVCSILPLSRCMLIEMTVSVMLSSKTKSRSRRLSD